MNALLSLDKVSVRFGQVQALQDVSLKVAPGEFVALVGPNGAGKTTLLRALHGLVRLQGQRQTAASSAGATPVRQAMVFQRPFMLRLSVANNLRVALWLAQVPRADWADRVLASLERVGLVGLGARPARALSGGQQQRLALARAWAVRPQLLFLDEPTASLDPAAKESIEALLASFAAEGMTLVMSTHNLGQVKRLASRVLYLEGGQIHADLPTAAFFAAATPSRAKQFLERETTWLRGA
jgi:tungstate transport system ATP-binding protein